jgi:hypothetical protein
MKRGEIWWASLPEPTGSGPGFRRPVLIVQSNPIQFQSNFNGRGRGHYIQPSPFSRAGQRENHEKGVRSRKGFRRQCQSGSHPGPHTADRTGAAAV